MDNHPPARRPHKSPAHTVKDRGTGLSASFPFRARCTKVPEGAAHHTANFGPSTPHRTLFLAVPALQFSPSRPSRSAGRALCTRSTANGKRGTQKLPLVESDTLLPPHGTRKRFAHATQAAIKRTRANVRLPTASTPSKPGANTPLRILDHFAIDAHRALLQLAIGLGVARRQTRGSQQRGDAQAFRRHGHIGAAAAMRYRLRRARRRSSRRSRFPRRRRHGNAPPARAPGAA